MAGQDTKASDVKYRHAQNGNRFSPSAGDKLVERRGTRTYGEARRMEHESIIKDGTLLQDRTGANAKNYRGNRQSGIGQGNLKKYYPAC
jgi:hypothetical protein